MNSDWFHPSRSIRTKVIAFNVILVIAVVILMATTLIRTETTLLREELKKRATALADNFARNCDYPLLLEDRLAIDKLAAAIMRDADIVSVSVVNTSGRVFYQQTKGVSEAGPPVPPAKGNEVTLFENKKVLHISLPVQAPSEEEFLFDLGVSPAGNHKEILGRVSIAFSLSKTNAQIRKTVTSSMAIAAAIAVATILILLFMMHHFIGPLMVLVGGIRELASGNLSHRVGIQRADEIGELASSFNEMAESVEHSRRQLEESNQTLEEKVRARTRELKASETRYRAFFESTGTAMMIVDEDGTISLVNAEFEKMFGYARDDVEGKKTWETFVALEDRVKMVNSLGQCAFDSEETSRSFELKAIDRADQNMVLFVTLSPIPGTMKKIGSIVDISDKKRLEEAFHQNSKMEAIGTLASGISHDFNNLLMGIQGYTSLMLLKIETGHPQHEMLKKIEEYVQSGGNLTRQLLGFARGGKYEIVPVNLNELVEKTSALFGRTKKELLIEKRYEKDLWTVEVDLGQIEQILLNLFVNAWHAMPGGGTLYLETQNVELDEHYAAPLDTQPGRYVKISVTDTGVGMDEKTKKRIFEPFFTTKEMGRGTGLGLATVYGIVRGHKGIINVYSEKGQGTSFHLYLPASEKAAVAHAPSNERLATGHETILLVDDEDGIVEVTREILIQLGYRVVVAKSGQDALDLYEREGGTVDLVILDMIMPGMSGGDTFDRLKALNPTVRVILSSGYSLNGMASQIMQRGCRSFIQKPFSIAALSQKIREAIQP
jgi:two-component system cell cycle sensor histidine kinase/response regulator CckA